DVENFIDFFDSVFGRKVHPKSETWILGYTFDAWRKTTRIQVNPETYPRRQPGDFLLGPGGRPIRSGAEWEERRQSIRRRIAEMLGEEPPRVPFVPHRKLTETTWSNEGWLATVFGRPTEDAAGQARLRGEGMGVAGVPFGDGLKGELFYPLGPDGKRLPGKLPVVIWLHPYSYQNGWSAGRPWAPTSWDYALDRRPSFSLLTSRGFAVFAFDQLGFGTRVHELRTFYDRYPHWSVLGNMISDTRSAVDALAALEEIDSSRIYLMGYALGGKVGLLTAAFEDRVKGVVSVCGFDPLRLDTPDKGTEGIRHYSHLHGLAPRLGFFLGHEDRLPFDFDEVLALVAPKPVLLIAPTLDRYARVADVRTEVERSRRAYRLLDSEGALELETPLEINRFPQHLQRQAADWIARAR
ncbi:MAG TPA: alpha/beta fold hydrolase, partial [Bryobacteraceae bacterium]|nr:alpha/beta fold hydrolase [Bryobacteraceae bacterium]